MVKVTIGVCVRNGENSISDAIRSIVDQDFPHELMEVVFVDDGSEDKTFSIINNRVQQMDMRTKLFHHKWRGLGSSRNVVVYNASGEYIIWVDRDMKLSRDFVRRQVEFMDRNPKVGIGKGKYGIYNTDSLVAYLENIEAVTELLAYEQNALSEPLGAGGSIYRLEAVKNAGGFDGDIKGAGEDIDAEHRVRKRGWLLQVTSAEFYELRRRNWKALWNEYFWHGSGGQSVYHRISPHNMLYRMFPPTIVFAVFSRSCNAYKLVRRKVVFLLPLHWIFKRTAWVFGFLTRLTRNGINNSKIKDR